MTLSDLTPGLHGQPADADGDDVPAGLTMTWTGAPQTNAGSYPVTATIADANYTGRGERHVRHHEGDGDGDAERV